MAIERVRFVLDEHDDLAETRIDAIAQGKVDDAVLPSEGDGGFRTLLRERKKPLAFAAGSQTIGLAICADSSQPSHPRAYAEGGATVYAAGVFLNEEWYATDAPRLAAYAREHRLLVVMANHGASVGTYTSVGRSAVWAPGGDLLVQAEGTESALVIAPLNRGDWLCEVVRL